MLGSCAGAVLLRLQMIMDSAGCMYTELVQHHTVDQDGCGIWVPTFRCCFQSTGQGENW